MAHLALLVVALEDQGKAKRNALTALHDFRRMTRGWHNGALIATALLAGQGVGRDESVEELRETLLEMPPQEVPFVGTKVVERSDVVPLPDRPIGVWTWKQNVHQMELGRETATLDPRITCTRADFLFAYWLARAAGGLDPGPVSAGAAPAGR